MLILHLLAVWLGVKILETQLSYRLKTICDILHKAGVIVVILWKLPSKIKEIKWSTLLSLRQFGKGLTL